MEKEMQYQKILEKMEKNSRRQLMYTRIMCLFSILAAVCCISMLLKLNGFLPEIQLFAQQAESVLSNLEMASQELAKADLNGMINNINTLVTTSQTDVADAIGKLSEIDIETLNKTINDLSVVVERLARIATIFG